MNRLIALTLRALYALTGLWITFLVASLVRPEVFAEFSLYAAYVAVIMPVLALGSNYNILRKGKTELRIAAERNSRISIFHFIFFAITFPIAIVFASNDWILVYAIAHANIFLTINSEMLRSRMRFTKYLLFGNATTSAASLAHGIIAITIFTSLCFLFLDSYSNVSNILLFGLISNLAAIMVAFLDIQFSKSRIRFAAPDIGWITTYLAKGARYSVVGLLFAFLAFQEIFFLQVLGNIGEIAEYTIILRISSMTMVIFTIFLSFAQPLFVKDSEADKNRKILKLYLIALALCTVSAIFVMTISPQLICILTDRSYCDISGRAVSIRTIGIYGYILCGFSAGFLILTKGGESELIVLSVSQIALFWTIGFILNSWSNIEIQTTTAISFAVSNIAYGLALAIKLKIKTGTSYSLAIFTQRFIR